ncbi:hypothetical protein [Mangrovitalea sediminis]|uniref:hypothetical protein n=1 Tax=Mangrovitalea sediminis TaxID=1982043 RepID=UPI000BE5D0DC|nr:hypothetical protein [Mangrovitalea sediminis]
MPEPDWLAYTGAITGIIGAVAGVAGAITACIALRRTKELKALDLRLELRRMEGTLQSDIQDLIPLLERAKTSYTRLAAAQGKFGSGATEEWISQWEADIAEARELVAGSTVLDIDCTGFSQAALEARLVTVHKLQNQVGKFAQKYQDSLAVDCHGREQLRADQRALMQAREGKH